MKLFTAMAAAVGILTAATAFAETPAKGDPAKAQQIVSTLCIACHGADGNSVDPNNPKLAGQHEAYLLKQLQDFKSGTRASPVMMGMVAALTPEDMKNLAAFFTTQKNAGGKAADPKQVELGQKIYRGGVMKTGVPACAGCHSPSGAGIPAQFPRLAGQHPEYIVAQLKLFRDEARANDPGRMMRDVAVKMTDKEMAAVAAYIAALK